MRIHSNLPRLESDPELAATVAPYGEQFPGPAPAQEQALTEAELAQAHWFGSARIGLVPAARPADVLALVGYNGTVNRYGTPELLSAVLRSWEDRFGAMLLEVGFNHIRLLARRPAADPARRPGRGRRALADMQ